MVSLFLRLMQCLRWSVLAVLPGGGTEVEVTFRKLMGMYVSCRPVHPQCLPGYPTALFFTPGASFSKAAFIRHFGIISPTAAIYAKAMIAGVQRDLPVYRRRESETTKKDWTWKTVEEEWHSRA